MSLAISRRAFLRSSIAIPVVCAAPGLAFSAPEVTRKLSGPFVHENLAIWLVHGPSAPGPVPLTLGEAMAKGNTHVYETGTVSELSIENAGDEEVFVQAGDIVKGGKQDRVLTVSLILPPRSGKMPIASYCVEQGRWTARGREDVGRFASSAAALPSREAKLAMKVAATAPTGSSEPRSVARTATVAQGQSSQGRSAQGQSGQGQSAQGKVWETVARTQEKLARSVGAPVASAQSATSMQLTLENAKLKATQEEYAKALAGKGEAEGDVVGFVFAINGRINSADLYPSNGLFRKMWRKNFDASVTEALADKGDASGETPAADTVLAFLDNAEKGKPSERAITQTVSLETREAPGNFMFETRGKKGGYVHRNYLAK